jgi:hypothetical protein
MKGHATSVHGEDESLAAASPRRGLRAMIVFLPIGAWWSQGASRKSGKGTQQLFR